MEKKVRALIERYYQVEKELGDPSVFEDQKRYKTLTQEHSYLSQIKNIFEETEAFREALKENQALLRDESDEELIEVVREEIESAEAAIPKLEKQLDQLLVPPDPSDHRNTIVELRAGTGGDEAALFVGNCVRMYKCFADKLGIKHELLASSPSDVGGFKEYIMVLSGANVFRFLRHEAGTHRVQRVPETETQGRVHTSAITVAVLLEPDEEEVVDLEEKDLRVDTYRASGAGGQHVNTTDSAVRITHIPTGMVAYCMEEKSQHKNRDKALRLLKAKIAEEERRKKQAAVDSARSTQIGSGDRSERIRTYNFPQNRITDHRINYTRYNLEQVMDGELDEVIGELVAAFHKKLQEL